MDNEMIERVARAILKDAGILETKDTLGTASRYSIVAIKAMREPTEKMLLAGEEAVSNCFSLEPGEGLDEPPAPAAWEAMIDAVIND